MADNKDVKVKDETVVSESDRQEAILREQFKAKKTPTVTMKVGHPHSPIILTDDESDLAMVLPVRLKAA